MKAAPATPKKRSPFDKHVRPTERRGGGGSDTLVASRPRAVPAKAATASQSFPHSRILRVSVTSEGPGRRSPGPRRRGPGRAPGSRRARRRAATTGEAEGLERIGIGLRASERWATNIGARRPIFESDSRETRGDENRYRR